MKKTMKLLPLLLLSFLLVVWPGQSQSGAQHSVTLSWTAGTPNAAIGEVAATAYNVKRASVAGGPYVTVGSVSTTTFTDTTVAAAKTYFYVITGTCPTCTESAPSLEVSASVPLDQAAAPTAPLVVSVK